MSRPLPPTVRALDADGSEFWLDAAGRAFRADSSRVPELDGPASAAPLDRGEVVRVLAERYAFTLSEAAIAYNGPIDAECAAQSWRDRGCEVQAVATELGLRAEFDALTREGGGA